MQIAFLRAAMDASRAFEFVMRINQNLYGNLFDGEQTMSDVDNVVHTILYSMYV